MRTVTLLLTSSLAVILIGCVSPPPLSVKNGLTYSARLTNLASSDIAVLPVEDATVDRAFGGQEAVLRQSVIAALPSRLFAGLDAGMVDRVLSERGGVGGSVVDPGYVATLCGAFDKEDAVLGLRITEWNTSGVMSSPPQVRFTLEVLMLESKSAEQICVGTYSGVLKPGGSSAAPLSRNDRIRAAAETLGEAFVSTIPLRNVRPSQS